MAPSRSPPRCIQTMLSLIACLSSAPSGTVRAAALTQVVPPAPPVPRILADAAASLTLESTVDRVTPTSHFAYYVYEHVYVSETPPPRPLVFHASSRSLFDGFPRLYVTCDDLDPTDDFGSSVPGPGRTHHLYAAAGKPGAETAVEVPDVGSSGRCPSGTYYVAVYAFSQPFSGLYTSYTLSVVQDVEAGAVALSEGVSASDQLVYVGLTKYYEYDPGIESGMLSFTVTLEYGGVLVFLLMVEPGSGDVASAEDYDAVEQVYDGKVISVDEGAGCADDAKCIYSIAVRGFYTTSYNIVAKKKDTTVTLNNGQPVREGVAAGSTQLYGSAVPDSLDTPADMVITVTVFSGRVTLTVVDCKKQPTCPPEQISQYGVARTVLVDTMPGRTVTFGVRGEVDSQFSIVAVLVPHDGGDSFKSVVTLMPGVQQYSVIGANDQPQYFHFSPHYGHDDAIVTLKHKMGNAVELLINLCPWEFEYCDGRAGDENVMPSADRNIFSSGCTASDVLATFDRHSGNETAGRYITAVATCPGTQEPSGDGSATFSVSARTEAVSTTLQLGHGHSETVGINEYSYYAARVPPNSGSFAVAVTSIVGDPDVYISRTIREPTVQNHTWASSVYGSDKIYIMEGDPNFCADCDYYIGVKGGAEGSSFKILVQVRTEQESLLSFGEPQFDHVDAGFTNLYVLPFDKKPVDETIEVSVAPFFGDPDIFIVLSDGESFVTPSVKHFDYGSVQAGQVNEVVTIDTGSKKFQELCPASCPIYISVSAAKPSDYTLTVSTQFTITQLMSAVPATVRAKKDTFRYFSFPVLSSDGIVTVQLTLTTGRPVIYVTCKNDALPDATETGHGWILNGSSGGDEDGATDRASTLTITSKGAGARGCNFPHTLTFGVYAAEQDANAILSVSYKHESGDHFTYLPYGKILTGSVSTKNIEYYKIAVGEADVGDTLEINSINFNGDVDLYLSRNWEERPVLDKHTGIVSNFSYASNHDASWRDEYLNVPISRFFDEDSAWNGTEFLVLAVTSTYESSLPCSDGGELGLTCTETTLADKGCDIYFCSGCEWEGECDKSCGFCNEDGISSSFALVAVTNATSTELMNGLPIGGYVEDKKYAYYSFTIPEVNKTDLSLTVTPFSGNPDVLIGFGNNRHPNFSNFNLASYDVGGENFILQTEQILNYCRIYKSCTFYIAVHGDGDTRYSIMLSHNSGWSVPLVLIDGYPQNGLIRANAMVYYSFHVSDNKLNSTIAINVNSPDGGHFNLYITRDKDKEPGPNNYDLVGYSFGGAESGTISSSDEMYCTDCTFYVGLHALEESSYTIVGSVGTIYAPCGVPVSGATTKGKEIVYFTYYHKDQDLEISLTSLQGTPNWFVVAGGGSELKEKDALWNSTLSGRSSIIFEEGKNLDCSNCIYTVGVYSVEEDSTFTLLFNSNECKTTILVNGRPQVGSLASGQSRSYQLSSRSSTDTLLLSMSMVHGEADLYVLEVDPKNSGISDVTFPNPKIAETFNFTTAGKSRDEMTIKGPYEENISFIITAVATTDCEFSLVSNFDASVTILQPGHPQRHFVESGSMEYFLLADNREGDVQIVLTVLTGNPDLLVSTKYKNPNCEFQSESGSKVSHCTNYTYKADSNFNEEVFISRANPCGAMKLGTDINDDNCENSSVFSSGQFYIGVFGFSIEVSSFSITANFVGNHINLVSGQPQDGSTILTSFCPSWNDDNQCATEAEPAEVAFFTFVTSATFSPKSHISFNFIPKCHDDLVPGCGETPVKIFVTSCTAKPVNTGVNKCSKNEEYPSPTHNILSHSYHHGQGGTLFIANDKLHPNNGFCNPYAGGQGGQVCIYYITVLYQPRPGVHMESAKFSLTVSTPGDLVVVPCRPSPAPDGVIIYGIDNAPQFYEVCGTDVVEDGILDVSLEVCAGDVSLYICNSEACINDIHPSEKNYYEKSTSKQVCKSGISGTCTELYDGIQRVKLQRVDNTGTYFVSTEGNAISTYKLIVSSYKDMFPAYGSVVPTLVLSEFSSEWSVLASKGLTGLYTLTWQASLVNMNGLIEPAKPYSLHYDVFLIESSELKSIKKQENSPNLSSLCGLELLLRISSSAERRRIGTMVNKFEYVPDKKGSFTFFIVAMCDGECLSQVSAKNSLSKIKCNGSSPCKTIHTVYSPIELYVRKALGASFQNRSSVTKVGLFFFLALGVCLVFVGIKLAKKYRKYRNHSLHFSNVSSVESNPFTIDDYDDEYAGSGGSKFIEMKTVRTHDLLLSNDIPEII